MSTLGLETSWGENSIEQPVAERVVVAVVVVVVVELSSVDWAAVHVYPDAEEAIVDTPEDP